MLLSWIFRVVLIAVGFVASWFVAKDSPQFGIMQMAVALILVVVIVAVLAFWPERWSHILNRLHKPPPSN
jgi:exosortase/archaeosortase